MPYYADTRKVNGEVLELDVFRTKAERDAWVAEGADIEAEGEGTCWEVGPRSAIGAGEARTTFGREEEWGYDWVVLHAGVRDIGVNSPKGTVYVPLWLDLTRYAEQPNSGNGVDWTLDVTFCLNGR